MEVLHHGGTSVVVFAEGSSMGLPIDGVEDDKFRRKSRFIRRTVRPCESRDVMKPATFGTGRHHVTHDWTNGGTEYAHIVARQVIF